MKALVTHGNFITKLQRKKKKYFNLKEGRFNLILNLIYTLKMIVSQKIS